MPCLSECAEDGHRSDDSESKGRWPFEYKCGGKWNLPLPAHQQSALNPKFHLNLQFGPPSEVTAHNYRQGYEPDLGSKTL